MNESCATNCFTMRATNSDLTTASHCIIWLFPHSIVLCVGNTPFPYVTVLIELFTSRKSEVPRIGTRFSLRRPAIMK